MEKKALQVSQLYLILSQYHKIMNKIFLIIILNCLFCSFSACNTVPSDKSDSSDPRPPLMDNNSFTNISPLVLTSQTYNKGENDYELVQ